MYLPLSQAYLNERPPRGERQVWGPVCFLNSAPVSLSLPGALCLLLSPRAPGGGKAPVSAKLTICLCAKLTGGWTSTQTLPMAPWPRCRPPQSPALAPCRPPPLPTPTLAGLAPQSMPEPLRSPPAPGILATKAGFGFRRGAAVASLGPPPAQGQPTQEGGGRVVPPISRVAHSSCSPLCSLPSGLLGGRKSNSRADRLLGLELLLKVGGGSAWPVLAKSTPGPCAATCRLAPSPCRAGMGFCGHRSPWRAFLVLWHTFWWFVFCARLLIKNSTACGSGWFVFTPDRTITLTSQWPGSWLHTPAAQHCLGSRS